MERTDGMDRMDGMEGTAVRRQGLTCDHPIFQSMHALIASGITAILTQWGYRVLLHSNVNQATFLDRSSLNGTWSFCRPFSSRSSNLSIRSTVSKCLRTRKGISISRLVAEKSDRMVGGLQGIVLSRRPCLSKRRAKSSFLRMKKLDSSSTNFPGELFPATGAPTCFAGPGNSGNDGN
jgi:hypothetical protein